MWGRLGVETRCLKRKCEGGGGREELGDEARSFAEGGFFERRGREI
jgi:hypothetical protein